MLELTSPNVTNLFMSCLYKNYNDRSGAITIRGVKTIVDLDLKKLVEKKQEIHELLSQCHPSFFENSKAKGWSFLNFCLDKNEQEWTSLQTVCDQLICLGIAIHCIEFLLERKLWEILPGGVPYLVIKNLEHD